MRSLLVEGVSVSAMAIVLGYYPECREAIGDAERAFIEYSAPYQIHNAPLDGLLKRRE